MSPNVHPLPFRGDLIEYLRAGKNSLTLLWRDREAYVAIKPICDALGIAWQPQHRKLTAPDSGSVVIIMVTTGADQKRYEMACLHLPDLIIWLSSISPNKVAPEAREALLTTRSEIKLLLWTFYKHRLLGEAEFASDLITREHIRLFKQHPLYIQIDLGMKAGYDFEQIRACGSASRPKLVLKVREAMALGLIATPPLGTPFATALAPSEQPDLFDATPMEAVAEEMARQFPDTDVEAEAQRHG